ncbi:DUF748 domain-containing protein [Geobacter sp. FeAm09]|uniref:DUF748 domain-containing protein n=1 Tax=Geobacter sp. FeAm09 TaxID=2597769 RepID=UPI0011EFDCD6|nr:DUF748 domain-containing protein [Geobacter sp. FeAm09]QEM68097.1 DUF748 domain-containing protein [Geobacter sp. FeAm09]
MSKQRKIAIIIAATFVALILFCSAILPLIVRSQAVAALGDAIGRKVRIEKVGINPFTLTVTVSGFAIEEKDGGPFVSIGQLRASLSLASIYKRALIISRVAVEAPSLSIARLAANRYNFNDIIERQKAKPKKESSGEFRFSINNITLANGSVDFDDQAVGGGRKHTVRDLRVAVPFISNIPYLVEKYTDPHISALVNGAPFSFSGKVKPLSKSMETSVHIDLRQLDLPGYVAYAPVRPPADLASGKLTVNTDVSYRISADKKPELTIRGLVQLDNIAVNLKEGQPLFRLPLFQVRASDLEVFARRFLVDNVTMEGLELFAGRTAGGEWMYQRLLPRPAGTPRQPAAETAKTTKTTAEAKSGSAPLLVRIGSFDFRNGVLHISDALPKGGFKGNATGINAAVKGFTTEPGKSADYEVALSLDNEAEFNADGAFSLAPLKATVSAELNDLKLQKGWPYLAGFLTAPLKGTLDLAVEAAYTPESGVDVARADLGLSGLSARYGDKEGFDLRRLEVNGAAYRQKENRLDLDEIMLAQGNVSLSREVNGAISLLSLLKKPQEQGASAKKAGAAKKTAAAGPSAPAREFSFRVKKVRLDKLAASFTDKTLSEKPHFTLRNTSLTLVNLNGPRFTPAQLRFSTIFDKATPLKASGTITPNPFHYKGSVSAGRLPLRDFEAYFPSNINVFVLGGSVDATMSVDIALKGGKPTGTFKGNAGIRGFHAIDTVAEEDLLKWESLQLDDIQGNLEPFSLALRQIALNGVYSRIIVRKDGTLNLQNLVEKPKPPAASPAAPAPAAPVPAAPVAAAPAAAAAPQQAAAKKQIQIGAVTIQDGTLSFSDNHLPQHFATTFYNLGGRVSGLSSEESKFADVDLRGNLENHSPLQITGRINPLRDDLFVDLKVSFRDIELSPVTPYSGTYLGYTVEKGKLYLDLMYRIDKKQLDAFNNIFIDQFTFGEKVESDKATKLPVKLGLALLKDRKGEIHLDVPVAGRTDDPKFSVWKLVFQVLRNLMVKAVTSPLSLLSSMFGNGQDFSAIQFSHGTSAIPPQEEQKLNALAKALLDRPALKVELKGYVDREKDTEGYRRELLERKVKGEKFLALGKQGTLKEGEKADSIVVGNDEYPTYLTAVYKKEKFPKPRNMLGLVKTLPPEEMKKLIIANTVIGEPELKKLAHERVVAVMNYLVAKGHVPAERVFQKNDDLFKAPEKETTSRSRVELNAIAQ